MASLLSASELLKLLVSPHCPCTYCITISKVWSWCHCPEENPFIMPRGSWPDPWNSVMVSMFAAKQEKERFWHTEPAPRFLRARCALEERDKVITSVHFSRKTRVIVRISHLPGSGQGLRKASCGYLWGLWRGFQMWFWIHSIHCFLRHVTSLKSFFFFFFKYKQGLFIYLSISQVLYWLQNWRLVKNPTISACCWAVLILLRPKPEL